MIQFLKKNNIKSLTEIFALIIISLFVSSCASTKYWGNYIQRNSNENLSLLKKSGDYQSQDSQIVYSNRIDSLRSEEIQNYFNKEGIPEEWLNENYGTTWDRTMLIAVWVAKNIKHSNPVDYPKIRNSIALWEYSKTHPKGFNCRMHSILLGELLTAAGIYNRFVCCESADKNNDPDCHVVNIVWLPELNKWAMIDSDMHEYVTDENCIPLSLDEMRTALIENKAFIINSFDGFKIDENYLKAYWTKNLYYFSNYGSYGYGLEDNTINHSSDELFFYLYPSTDINDCGKKNEKFFITNDKEAFWAKPKF